MDLIEEGEAAVRGDATARERQDPKAGTKKDDLAIRLIKEDDGFAVLSDILGDEDHLGDMDFKVAGTSEGITAIQLDLKIEGISFELLTEALAQAKEGRMHILGLMNEALPEPSEMSEFAPRIVAPAQIPSRMGRHHEWSPGPYKGQWTTTWPL